MTGVQTCALPIYSKENGHYVIRDEGLTPFMKYEKYVKSEVIEGARQEALKELVMLLKQAFHNQLQIKTINMQEQLKCGEKELKDKNTISLDTYYKGTFNIQTSRMFEISDLQDKYISLIGRLGHETIEKQIQEIKDGNYILVDDDSATGKTIEEIMTKLPERINIEQIYLLASMLNEKIFDIVDFRDFIIGAENGGLVVRLPNDEVARAPYVLPYVCLKTRATIEATKEMDFSIKVWEINKKFYEKIGNHICLKDTDKGFQKLMKYIGFKDDTKLVDICVWHIERLKVNG